MDIILTLMVFLLYLLPFFIVYAILANIYYRIKAKLVNRLTYSRDFSASDAFAGDELYIIETITNSSALPVFFVDIESYIHPSLILEDREKQDGMQLVISRFHLRGHSKITRRHKVICAARGYFTMNTATVLTKGFGFESLKDFTFSSELYVYPEIASQIPLGSAIGKLLGNSTSEHRTVYDPFSISGVRDYTFGDPFNSINFKATARSFSHGRRDIKVNSYAFCCDRTIMLCLDFSAAHELEALEEYESRLEKALSLCATLALYVLKNGHKIGFTANCGTVSESKSILFPITGGEFRITELLRAMAKIRTRAESSFISVLEGQRKSFISGTEIYILSPSSDPYVAQAIDRLKSTNNVSVIKI